MPVCAGNGRQTLAAVSFSSWDNSSCLTMQFPPGAVVLLLAAMLETGQGTQADTRLVLDGVFIAQGSANHSLNFPTWPAAPLCALHLGIPSTGCQS
ncbi:hypothetical protein SRHO_G00293940 [Serrasalmus rhombeus]